MSCPDWEEKIALQVEGDLAAAEVERHLESCAPCRDFAEGLRQSLGMLREAHREPLADADFAAVRARVLERVQVKRRWIWWPAWAGAAAVAALVGWLWLSPASQAPPEAGQRPAPPVIAQVSAPAPVMAQAEQAPRKHRGRRRAPVPPPTEPLVVKLITDDPDVVIYWIVDPQGD